MSGAEQTHSLLWRGGLKYASSMDAARDDKQERHGCRCWTTKYERTVEGRARQKILPVNRYLCLATHAKDTASAKQNRKVCMHQPQQPQERRPCLSSKYKLGVKGKEVQAALYAWLHEKMQDSVLGPKPHSLNMSSSQSSTDSPACLDDHVVHSVDVKLDLGAAEGVGQSQLCLQERNNAL